MKYATRVLLYGHNIERFIESRNQKIALLFLFLSSTLVGSVACLLRLERRWESTREYTQASLFRRLLYLMSFDKITFIPRHLDICMFDLVAGARESTPILSSVGCLNFPEAKLRLLSIILHLFHSFLFIHADFKGASLGQLSVTTRPVWPDDFVQIRLQLDQFVQMILFKFRQKVVKSGQKFCQP